MRTSTMPWAAAAFTLALALGITTTQAQAALPGLFYSATLASDTNATPAFQQLPISPLSLSPYTTVTGSPAASWTFTTAGTYKVTASFFVQGDANATFGFNVFWEMASQGTYTAPVITTPESFTVNPLVPNTATYTFTIDSFTASVGDRISMIAAVRPRTAGATYGTAPRILKGLGTTTMTLQAVP